MTLLVKRGGGDQFSQLLIVIAYYDYSEDEPLPPRLCDATGTHPTAVTLPVSCLLPLVVVGVSTIPHCSLDQGSHRKVAASRLVHSILVCSLCPG